jgi:hypothetical protein
VGATLTGVGLGAITLDGNTPIVGNRLLVKNQVSTFQNGIYTVTIVGTAGTVFVLTRSLDFNQQTDVLTGAATYVVGGTALAGTTWDVNSADSPVIGTDAITFVQSAGPGSVVQGNGITITGTSIAINTGVTADLSTTQTLTNKTIDGVTPTVMGYVDPTSSIQTQLNAKGVGTWTDSSTSTGSNKTFVAPALGTPASGVGTNLTGIPIAGLVASTSTALGVGSIELGHATDTTLTRSAGGVLAVEGVVIPSISSTNTLTNKRITPRILSHTSYTTDTGTDLNCDNLDQLIVTAQAGALKLNNPTGTAVDGQKLIVAVTGTAARALTYDTQFEASTVALPATTATTARINLGFIWRADTSKWVLVAVA